ncbi:MAG: hypothetical protein KKA42_01295, partial [candidate division Zixibacteria bacterium]|nr:hypothetical protein [candidate division Zixibacteria bacterium]
MRTQKPIKTAVLLCIYLSINGLFVAKYSGVSTAVPWLTVLGYLLLAGLALGIPLRYSSWSWLRRSPRLLTSTLLAVSALGLFLLMRQYDPSQIASGRYPAIVDWLSRLFAGQFPYTVSTEPSGFPFLFVLASPFYWLGDVGLLQIGAFVAFGIVIVRAAGDNHGHAGLMLLALLASPAFLYEVVVRSELFSNMVALLLYVHFCRVDRIQKGFQAAVFWGLAAGLLLSTRGTALPVLVLFGGYLLHRAGPARTVAWGTGLVAGFWLTLLPFLIWDADAFFSGGPFAIQTSYLPGWTIVLAMLATVGLAWRVQRRSQAYYLAGVVLFATVAIA